MAAIITDQLRILNAKNFVSGVGSTGNSYYSFVGVPNPTDFDSAWNTTPPSPKYQGDYCYLVLWQHQLLMKKIKLFQLVEDCLNNYEQMQFYLFYL